MFSPDAAANSDPEVQRSLHSPLVLGAKQAPLQLDVAVYGVADMPAANANANATPRMLQQPVKAVDSNLPNPSSPAAPCASSTSSLRSIMELLAKDESNDEYWGLDTSAPTSSCDSLHTGDSVSRCDRDEADDPVINEMVLKAKALMLQEHQLLQVDWSVATPLQSYLCLSRSLVYNEMHIFTFHSLTFLSGKCEDEGKDLSIEQEHFSSGRTPSSLDIG